MRWSVLAAAIVVLAGCGATAGHTRSVSRSVFGSRWPLTADSGTLSCVAAGAVSFTAPDGTTYWLNGTGSAWADANGLGWLDVRPIWANEPHPVFTGEKKDIGVLIDAGLKLCGND